MYDKVYINNENLANFVMFKLGKIDNGFTEKELGIIEEVVIDYNDEVDNSFVFLDEILKFKNIKSIILRNGYIYNVNYNIFLKLHNLTSFTFENCEFENIELISSLNLKSLSLINCMVENYIFINILDKLEELTIINGKISIKNINMLKNLKYLQLSYCSILDNFDINNDKIEELYIDNTNISDFDFLVNLSNLKILSIDIKQYNSDKDFFEKLMNKNVLVLNENMIGFNGGING